VAGDFRGDDRNRSSADAIITRGDSLEKEPKAARPSARVSLLSHFLHLSQKIGVQLAEILAESGLEFLEPRLGIVPKELLLLGEHLQVGYVLLRSMVDQIVIQGPSFGVGIERGARIADPLVGGNQ
jgi:hypothetical protein